MKKEYLRPCSDTVALSGVGGIMEVLHLGSSLNHNDAKAIECYTEDEDDLNEVENLCFPFSPCHSTKSRTPLPRGAAFCCPCFLCSVANG